MLVTGGGGSIGSELCRQVMRFRPGKLLFFDIYENCAYELLMELQQKYGRDIPVTVLDVYKRQPLPCPRFCRRHRPYRYRQCSAPPARIENKTSVRPFQNPLFA